MRSYIRTNIDVHVTKHQSGMQNNRKQQLLQSSENLSRGLKKKKKKARRNYVQKQVTAEIDIENTHFKER